VPVVNPDGYEYTHTEDRLWRKSRSRHNGDRCIGVDLNRNFDFHWGGKPLFLQLRCIDKKLIKLFQRLV
jgi:murein tripeptide amidase MpaA